MPENRSTYSNLFSVNLDEIENIITDANSELLKQFEDLQEKITTIPEKISNENENKEAKKILSELKILISDFKKARLDDGRPFSDASKIIKNWFNDREQKLKTNLNSLNKKISDFLLNIEEIEIDNQNLSHHRRQVPVTWSVAGFDRKEINIEEIKMYLTDFAIQKAIEKHLSVHGPNKLTGVSYEKNAII